MADPQTYRPNTRDIPAEPGVYRFIDADGRVLYVGKAKSLRSRLVNYFQPPQKLHPRTRRMVWAAVRVMWVVVPNERAALTLEYQWIKEFSPRFNVIFRDDKSYPYLAVTVSEEYPRLMGTRAAHKKGNKYYGPYTQGSIKNSVDLLLKVFPVRSCSAGAFRQAQRSGRPCLRGYIDRCVAPCVGRVSQEEHRNLVNQLVDFLDSDGSQLIKEKKRQMSEAAQAQRYEQAAHLRDEIRTLEAVEEKNPVVLDTNVDADVFGIDADELEASVQVFYVRAGRIRGQRGWISERDGTELAGLLEEMLIHVYGEGAQAAHAADVTPYVYTQETAAEEKSGLNHQLQQNHYSTHEVKESSIKHAYSKNSPQYVDDVRHTPTNVIPREIWLPAAVRNKNSLEEWLSDIRLAPVRIKTPQRGKKADLVETVNKNAAQALMRHKLARTSDLTVRSQALEDLHTGLGLDRAPLRIECFDISHTQGTYPVASMVVFEDGLAKKSDYRKFIVHSENGATPGDTAAMAQVLRRRLERLVHKDPAQPYSSGSEDAGTDAGTAAPRRFAYRPDLIVVDGGLPQVNAAAEVVEQMNADVAVVGLAKRLEEVWIPGEDFPLILPRQSAALHLLQYIRDESHRFAITFHRKKRASSMVRSALDGVPGLGPAKQKALIRKFGSLAQIKKANAEQLQQVNGIGPVMAQAIVKYFANQ